MSKNLVIKLFASKRLLSTALTLSVILLAANGARGSTPAAIPALEDLAKRYGSMLQPAKASKKPPRPKSSVITEIRADMANQPVSALLPLLIHPLPELRQAATYTLNRRYSTEVNTLQVRQQVTVALKSEKQEAVLSGLFNLAVLSRAKAAIPSISQILLSPQRSESLRSAAAKTLSELGDRSAVPFLLEAAQQNSSRLSEACLAALVILRDRKALPLFRSLAQDERSPQRLTAIAGLGTLGDTQSLPYLQKLLSHSKPGIQEAAITALGTLRAKSVIPNLATLLNNRDSAVRDSAFQALLQIGGSETLRVFLKRYSTHPKDSYALQGISMLYDVRANLPKANIESDLAYLAETLTPLLPPDNTLPVDRIIRAQHITQVRRLDDWYFVSTDYGGQGSEFLVRHQGANWLMPRLIDNWIS